MEYLFIMYVAGLLTMMVLMNKKCKYYMWDSIPSKHVFMLSVRVSLNLAYIYVNYFSVKALPLVLIGIFRNLVPLITSIFSYLLLKEGITKVEIICLLIASIGVYTIIYY